MTKALRLPEGLDTTKPSPARIYDYMLRGTSHFDVDEEAAKRILNAVPEIKDCAWSNRGFHQRAAAWIARQGVRQFIDIGSGLPTIGNTHEVVKKIHPDARVVYVDNDPMVELYSQTILDERLGQRALRRPARARRDPQPPERARAARLAGSRPAC